MKIKCAVFNFCQVCEVCDKKDKPTKMLLCDGCDCGERIFQVMHFLSLNDTSQVFIFFVSLHLYSLSPTGSGFVIHVSMVQLAILDPMKGRSIAFRVFKLAIQPSVGHGLMIILLSRMARLSMILPSTELGVTWCQRSMQKKSFGDWFNLLKKPQRQNMVLMCIRRPMEGELSAANSELESV